MKKKCLVLLLMAMLLASQAALAQQTSVSSDGGSSSSAKKEELDVWNVDYNKLDAEDVKELERLKEEARQDRLKKMREEAVPKEKYYDNNSVCAFGPQFRDVSGKLTKEWYMFTPVDLSRDGTQTFELIAANMHVVGSVRVTVENGRFTVDYTYNSKAIKPGREYFTFFKDFESITRKDMDNFKKHYTYGKTYSIEEKLGGDTDVILFVCNTATYRATASGLVRYYSSNPAREQLREAMLDMIGK